ncbi:MAG: hypothetical protein YYHSYBAR_000797 [Candidatus Fervidibacter sacchari]
MKIRCPELSDHLAPPITSHRVAIAFLTLSRTKLLSGFGAKNPARKGQRKGKLKSG